MQQPVFIDETKSVCSGNGNLLVSPHFLSFLITLWVNAHDMEKILNQDLDKDEYYRILNCFSSSNVGKIKPSSQCYLVSGIIFSSFFLTPSSSLAARSNTSRIQAVGAAVSPRQKQGPHRAVSED